MTTNLWHFYLGMKFELKHNLHRLWPLGALVTCALVAWSATLIKWKPPAQEIVPFVIVGIVLLLGLIFGRSVGILGSIIAALVFAYSMYEPLGSLRIADQRARSGLAWMLLAGVTLSYLLLPVHGDRSKRGH
jgi:K+-sensing histidine kinase KdpD